MRPSRAKAPGSGGRCGDVAERVKIAFALATRGPRRASVRPDAGCRVRRAAKHVSRVRAAHGTSAEGAPSGVARLGILQPQVADLEGQLAERDGRLEAVFVSRSLDRFPRAARRVLTWDDGSPR